MHALNGQEHKINLPLDLPLLWVLRYVSNLNVTKLGCGVGPCDACTAQIDVEAVRSCQVTLNDVRGDVTTIGSGNLDALFSLQKSSIENYVAQC